MHPCNVELLDKDQQKIRKFEASDPGTALLLLAAYAYVEGMVSTAICYSRVDGKPLWNFTKL